MFLVRAKILSDVAVCGEVGVVRWYGGGYI